VNVLLFALGSDGDVHPFIGLGLRLRARGHRVTIVANGHFEPLVRRTGFAFVEVGTDAEYREILKIPGVWETLKGFRIVAERLILQPMRGIYAIVQEHNIPGETMVAAPATAVGARIAQEHLDVPLVTVCLQPAMIRSFTEPPLFAGLPLSRKMPRAWNRIWFWLADQLVTEQVLGPELNAYRAELGLPPIREPLMDWWLSPTRVLGLFPDWFATPQADWPAQTVLTGFPLYDESDAIALSPEATAFLDVGDPPIAFTPGSANCQAQAFFEAAVDACRRLGRRGVLITRYPDQVPGDLPSTIRAFEFLPFSRIFPRAAAVVHHGGIGTSAQALQAGVPQIVMPLAHDQHDNAARLERLGVARSLAPRRFRGTALARQLAALVDSPTVAEGCRQARERFRAHDPLDESCRVIEEAVNL
jgi:rhamnosyltransferase subunit B